MIIKAQRVQGDNVLFTSDQTLIQMISVELFLLDRESRKVIGDTDFFQSLRKLFYSNITQKKEMKNKRNQV